MAEIGTVLGGRYRLMELLAQGGMASIFRARDTQLERDVAVKVLRPEYGRDPDFLARFKQEAQAAAGLNHPNVVAVYDFGQDPAGPYLVMELVDGQDLATILRQNGALSARQAARITSATARALQAAHDRGVVHRDVKPGNIMVSRDGRVRVTDFGIARAVAESQLTLPGTTLGSVHYFSPEQARGEPTTPASDVYALGIVLFETLTGRRPWEGDSAAVIAVARLSGPVPMPSAYHAGIPSAVEAIDRKALAPEPQDRFSSAAAMADALDVYLGEAAGADETTGPIPVAGLAAGAAAGAVAAGAVSGVASPSRSSGIPYSPDSYVGGDQAGGGAAPPAGAYPPDDDDRDGGTSVWTWIAGLLGIGILIVIGFLAFQLLAGGGSPGESPAPGEVEVPDLVGLTVQQATTVAVAAGLEVLPDSTIQSSDLPDGSDLAEGEIAEQDPESGAVAEEGSTIRVTIVVGPGVVEVPDVRNQQEAQATNTLFIAGFTIGTRTEEFDEIVPVGAVISTDPRPGIEVAKGTQIDYVVSKGPEPSPSPSPSPSPEASPSPSPSPTEPTEPSSDEGVPAWLLLLVLAAVIAGAAGIGYVLATRNRPGGPA